MTRDELEKTIRSRPFRPFRLRMADGFRYNISIPDQLMMHAPNESNRIVIVGMPGGRTDHVDIGFAVAIEFPGPDEPLQHDQTEGER